MAGDIMAIQWRADLAIGIEEVDMQHKELFRRVNQLLDACNRGAGKQEVGKVLEFLGDYVKTHFSTEEEYQQNAGYPKYEDHKQMHNAFVQELQKLQDKYAEEGPTLSFTLQINRTVVDWLMQHVSRVDREFGKFVQENTG